MTEVKPHFPRGPDMVRTVEGNKILDTTVLTYSLYGDGQLARDHWAIVGVPVVITSAGISPPVNPQVSVDEDGNVIRQYGYIGSPVVTPFADLFADAAWIISHYADVSLERGNHNDSYFRLFSLNQLKKAYFLPDGTFERAVDLGGWMNSPFEGQDRAYGAFPTSGSMAATPGDGSRRSGPAGHHPRVPARLRAAPPVRR